MIDIWPAGDGIWCSECERGRHRIVDLDSPQTNPLHYIRGRAYKCEAPDIVFDDEFKAKVTVN